ncbi:ATP-binding protein [Vibrio barjaei]|uniref:ATP-binding protein n=1 Tax=Vibrio barjaei TaxID=1676683 RepID=UPI0022848B10|nr:ATP-binding protein [Vibrio barjaei]MCY9874779.1 ATP-binding protein [Vibrio barjaei]
MKELKLTINKENYLNNIRYTFSNSQTIFHEMIQNSIRAKATDIEIIVEADETERKVNSITITDNGVGVTDSQVLFSIADSDWDSETMEAKRPFGFGFIAALNAGGHIEIESNNFRIAEYTDCILDQETFTEETLDTPRTGTRIKISDVNEELSKLILDNAYSPTDKLIKTNFLNWCRGYSANITINGEAVDNSWSIDKLMSNEKFSSYEFEFGTLFIPNFITSHCSAEYILQGKIMDSRVHYSIDSETVIVHLKDDTPAVMPDREKLKNAKTVKDATSKAYIAFMRQWVQDYLNNHNIDELNNNAIVQKRALNFAPELLNDIEIIPHELATRTDDFSMDLTDYCRGHVHMKSSWTKDEYKDFILVEAPSSFDNYEPSNNVVVQHMISLPERFLFVDTHKLHVGHWLKSAVKPLESFKATVKTEGKSKNFCVEIDEINEGAFCEDIYTTLEDYEGIGQPDFVTDKGELLATNYCIRYPTFLRELSSFDREGSTDISYLDEKMFEIESLLKRFSAKDVASSVKLTLDDARFFDTVQLMRNKRFEVSVDEKGNVEVIEVETEAA